ncbi:hypothetical protein [Brevundimonas sp.]|jgi:hypothetical protein|uniref:hypothetical protein n=1 Tax=Brevundimonas sp. TaxID=1871086 RepID=UPI002E0E0186|nr:hypothetical protein [Brevundimonas sp.]
MDSVIVIKQSPRTIKTLGHLAGGYVGQEPKVGLARDQVSRVNAACTINLFVVTFPTRELPHAVAVMDDEGHRSLFPEHVGAGQYDLAWVRSHGVSPQSF